MAGIRDSSLVRRHFSLIILRYPRDTVRATVVSVVTRDTIRQMQPVEAVCVHTYSTESTELWSRDGQSAKSEVICAGQGSIGDPRGTR